MLKEAQGKYRIGLYVQAMRWIEKGLREIETDSAKAGNGPARRTSRVEGRSTSVARPRT